MCFEVQQLNCQCCLSSERGRWRWWERSLQCLWGQTHLIHTDLEAKINSVPSLYRFIFSPSSFGRKQISAWVPEAGQQGETHPITPASPHPPLVTLGYRGGTILHLFINWEVEKPKPERVMQTPPPHTPPSVQLFQKAGADSHPQLDHICVKRIQAWKLQLEQQQQPEGGVCLPRKGLTPAARKGLPLFKLFLTAIIYWVTLPWLWARSSPKVLHKPRLWF